MGLPPYHDPFHHQPPDLSPSFIMNDETPSGTAIALPLPSGCQVRNSGRSFSSQPNSLLAIIIMSDHHQSEPQGVATSPCFIRQLPEQEKKPSTLSSSSSSTCPAPSSSCCITHHQQPASAPSPPTSLLGAFVHRDIQPQDGHRLLLPFLTTMDRLRLSECSQALLNYRYHLSKVKVKIINPYPSPIPPGVKKGLEELLMKQHGLEHLHLAHQSVLHVLDMSSVGWLEGLKTLVLSRRRGEKGLELEHAHLVARSLRGGHLRGLEELNMTRWTLTAEGWEAVLGALKAGSCPQLRRLTIAGDHPVDGQGSIRPIVEALGSGHLRHLLELDISSDYLVGDGGAAIARALQDGACPQLVKLNLSHCELSLQDCQALAGAMRSGACAKLENLGVGGSNFEESFMAIFGALEAGSCPSLERLDLRRAQMSSDAATALAHALRSGNCQDLEALDLDEAFDEGCCTGFMQVFKLGTRGGALSNLIHLDMSSTHMDQWCVEEKDGQVLGEAIGAGLLPRLEVLKVAFNEGCDVVPIMAGLEEGGCRQLKTLGLAFFNMGRGEGLALARALASGNLSCLQDLDVSGGEFGEEVMVEVIKGLRQCHQLRKLDASCMFGADTMGVMAGQALVQALQDKSWPELEGLHVFENGHLLREEGVVVGLAEVLERKGDLCPRLKELKIWGSGLDEKGEGGGRLARLLLPYQSTWPFSPRT